MLFHRCFERSQRAPVATQALQQAPVALRGPKKRMAFEPSLLGIGGGSELTGAARVPGAMLGMLGRAAVKF